MTTELTQPASTLRPWYYEQYAAHGEYAGAIVTASDDSNIANFGVAYVRHMYHRWPETVGNAALLTLAPEMYKLLIELAENFRYEKERLHPRAASQDERLERIEALLQAVRYGKPPRWQRDDGPVVPFPWTPK